MKKLLILVGGISLIILLLIVGKIDFIQDEAEIIIKNDIITWEDAIVILNSGKVESIAQTHSLDVSFYLEDDTSFLVKEPSIDMIFSEVEKCGKPCKNISLLTE